MDGRASRDEWRLYGIVIDVSVWVSNCRVGVGVGSSGHIRLSWLDDCSAIEEDIAAVDV